MLGVCLLFVGIVLINNGMCSLYNVDGKSTAIMNIFTGGLSLFINFVNLVQGNYYAAGTGLLFCFTYLCSHQCGDLRYNRGIYRKHCTGNHTGSALGSNLVSVGNSLGNCFRRRYLRKKTGKIRSISSGI